MKPPTPGQIGGKVQTLATLVRAGMLRPQRPDRLAGAALALARWGVTPAAGYAAAAARRPDDLALVDESGTLTFRAVHARLADGHVAIAHSAIRRSP